MIIEEDVAFNPHILMDIRKSSLQYRIAFISGCFDLLHADHVRFLIECGEFNYLTVIGVASDEVVRARKGPDRPIFNRQMRMEMLDGLRHVSYIFRDTLTTPDHLLEPLLNFTFQHLKPDHYIVRPDDFDIPARQEICDKYGVKLVVLPPSMHRTSTTEVAKRLKNGEAETA